MKKLLYSSLLSIDSPSAWIDTMRVSHIFTIDFTDTFHHQLT
jgi:hypothetical protein